MTTYYAVYKSVDDVFNKKGKALEVTPEQYLAAFRPEEDGLDQIVVFKDEKSALKVAKDGFNAKATDQFPIFKINVDGKLKKATQTLEDGKTKVEGFLASVDAIEIESASLAYLGKGFKEVDLTNLDASEEEEIDAPSDEEEVKKSTKKGKKAPASKKKSDKKSDDKSDDKDQDNTASTFPWKKTAVVASAVAATSAAFHFAGGLNLLALAAAKAGVAVPAVVATAPAALIAVGVGALAVGVVAGLYTLANLATSYFVKTDKQRYEAEVKAEDDVVRELETKLDKNFKSNKKDEAFINELEGYLVDAPEAKFAENGAAAAEDEQPKFNKLHVLQFAHKKLEAIVEIKNIAQRAAAEEKVLDKLHKKLGA